MRWPVIVASVAGLVVMAGGLVFVSGKFAHEEIAATKQRANNPHVTLTRPAPDATDVPPTSGIVAEITLPTGAGVDPNTLAAGVSLVRVKDGAVIPCHANTSGAGDDVVLKPIDKLDLATQYKFAITSDLKATDGGKFDPYTMTFTTADKFEVSTFPASFEQVDLPAGKLDKNAFTSMAIGPDGKLYAGTFAGMIYRFTIKPDGDLAPVMPPITSLLKANHGPRLVTGILFDPASTADSPILWVSHGQFAMTLQGKMEGAEDWTGKISRITGSNFDAVQDVVVGLPRAYKDHLNFQLCFGPDGALYFNQGSDTSVGGDDKKWGYRKEHLLTAATLRLDLSKLGLSSPPPLAGGGGGRGPEGPSGTQPTNAPQNPSPYPLPQGEGGKKPIPLDVKTEDGGTYDPYAADAPLTIYATGIRSGFHLLLHSNGHLYCGVNGAAGNEGNVLPSPDGSIPGIRDIKETTDDMLIDIHQGDYFGHPNFTRKEYVLNGGNPTAGIDPMEVTEYPVGVKPEKNWRPPTYDFGKNFSPNGLIEYHSNQFYHGSGVGIRSSAALDGCILVTRYSDGKDILVLKLTPDGRVAETIAGIDGFTKFHDPLDLIEDPKTGNIYVAEYSGQKITLLRPVEGKPSTQTQITKSE